jgi:pSer/pThr/pTyr-binding forkhead associated (FHA) protein
MDDDDLIFTDDADAALRKKGTRPARPSKRRPSGGPTRKPADPATRKPPTPEDAGRPHCLESPVLPEPLLMGRSKRYQVGRADDVDVRIRSERVSSRHAEVYWNGTCFVVVDLESTNGTELNGHPLPKNKPIPLHDGDTLEFGGLVVTVNALQPGEFPEQDLGGPTKKMRRIQ